MLIRFHIDNYLSFKNETEFSMVAGKSTQHPNHKIKASNTFSPDILRTTAIFGKNASGKSNFIKALIFARELITNSPSPGSKLSVRPFRLDPRSLKEPSGFRFELLIKGKVYDYGFSINKNSVVEEWLYEVKRTTDTLLFKRERGELTLGKIDYSQSFSSSKKITNDLIKEQQLRLHFVGEDTRENQLFLTASIERNQPYFKDIYDWFDSSLSIIRPDSKYLGTEFQIIEGDKNDNFISDFEKLLKEFDTDIEGIQPIQVDVEKDLIKAYPYIKDLEEIIEGFERSSKVMLPMPDGLRFALIKDASGNLSCYKLMTKHKRRINPNEELFQDAENYELFEINWESQGTQRLMDLIPSLLIMKNTSSTIFIDEIARSLHPELSYKFIKIILANKNLYKSQIIFTSHEDYLLDLNLLRRDEVWFAEKNEFGESSLYSLEEFKPRYDKDIRKGYLNGRFGGVPMINEEGINQVLLN